MSTYSTETDPIAFFESFFYKNYFETLRDTFFEGVDNDRNLHFTIHEFDKKKEFKVINSENVVGTEEEDISDGQTYLNELKEWETRKVIFEEHVYKIIKKEQRNSIILLNSTIKEAPNTSRAKVIVCNTINTLERLIECSEKDIFKKYKEIKRPLFAIVKYLYKSHRCHTPKKTDEIKRILNSRKGIYPQINQMLKPSFIEEILNLYDGDDNLLLENIATMKNGFISLIVGDIDSIEFPIKFQWGNQSVYYLITQIKDRTRIKLKVEDIINSDKIQFKTKPKSSQAFYTGASKFRDTFSDFKNSIDEAISKNLVISK